MVAVIDKNVYRTEGDSDNWANPVPTKGNHVSWTSNTWIGLVQRSSEEGSTVGGKFKAQGTESEAGPVRGG